MDSQNHIVAALTRLRRGVTFCAAGVCVAALIQLFVFGFVHFTDVRYQTLTDQSPREHRAVVVTPTAGVREGAAPDVAVAPVIEEAAGSVVPGGIPEVNRVATTADVVLMRVNQGAVLVGIFSAVGLAVLTLLGAVVAGGASVPGVEKAVSACMWGLGLCLLALPWRDIFASMPFGGVFAGYESMTLASESATETARLALVFVGLPAAAIAGAMITGLRFAAGVERGILINQAAAPMDAVDSAMTATRETLSTNRQLGSVRNDFVATPSDLAAPSEPAQRPRAAEPPARRRTPLSMSQSDEQPEYKRPI